MELFDIEDIAHEPVAREVAIQLEEDEQVQLKILDHTSFLRFVVHFAEVFETVSNIVLFPDEELH